MKGEKWRQMKAALSPALIGTRMTEIFEFVAECADDVVKHCTAKAENGERVDVEMKDFFSRYTTDVISSCGFGFKINSFAEPENEFFVNGKNFLNFANIKQVFRLILMSRLPAVARAFNVSLSGSPAGQYLRSVIQNQMKLREQNNIERFDMINTMMQIRKGTLKQTDEKIEKNEDAFTPVEESDVGKATVSRDWTDEDIVAQCFTFLLAGFDTSSSLLPFVAYELAINPDTQQRLYEEILETNNQLDGNRITYDALQKMKYLDQVISETLRKWPPAVQLNRLCTKDYTFDDGNRLKFKIEKGTPLSIPVFGKRITNLHTIRTS